MGADRLSAIWANPEQLPSFSLPEWEIVLGQALRARLLARLAQHFCDRGWLPLVPEPPRQYLEGGIRLADRQHHEVQWEVDCIRRALKNVDTPIVLLKGAAYLVSNLPPGRGRLFSDIDIMVKRDQLDGVESALFAHGWISEERDAYNNRYYRRWMHEIPPMKHVQRNTVIDVHHTITPPTSHFNVNGAKLLDRIVTIDEERKLFTLSPTDMVLHSAVHLFQEGEFSHGLRDLLDLNDLLLHFGKNPGFWKDLFTRARELGLSEPLFHALQHTHHLFGTDTPPSVRHELRTIRPNWLTRHVMFTLLNLALRPHHPSCDQQFSNFARWLLYVRSHYLRMPWYLVLPHLIRKAYKRRFPEQQREETRLNRPRNNH